MKSYTIAIVLAFAIAAYAAPIDNYERLNGDLENSLKVLGEQARIWVENLKADVTKQRTDVMAGNKPAIVKDLKKGAKDTENGAKHAKKNAKLYQLASQTAPAKLKETAQEIQAGKAKGPAVTKLMGEFAKQVEKDIEIPTDM